MVHHQIDPWQQAAEVVRLHVHRRDAIEGREVGGGHGFHVDIEQVGHAEVFRPGHALHGADDGGGPRPAQHVTQCQAGGQRVRVRLVVQHDQHAVGVRKVPLILLHPRAGQRSAQLRRQRRRQQLGQVEVRDFRYHGAQLVLAAPVRHAVHVQDVEQAAAGIADRGDDPLQAALAVVLNNDGRRRREARADVGVHAFGVAEGGRHPGFHETPDHRAAFDKEINVECPGKHSMQGLDDQLVLTDGQRAHDPDYMRAEGATLRVS